MSSQIVDGMWHYNVHVVKLLFTTIRIRPTCTGNQSEQCQNIQVLICFMFFFFLAGSPYKFAREPPNCWNCATTEYSSSRRGISGYGFLLPVLFLELLVYINSEDRSNWFRRAADNDNQTETRVTIEKTGDTSVLAVFDSGEWSYH